jgi:hypothetical protein
MNDRLVNAIIIATLGIVAIVGAIALGDACLGGQCPGKAEPTPAPSVTPQAQVAAVTVNHRDSHAPATTKKTPPPWTCKDKAAKLLYTAGFTGYAHKQAWAITYRESRHQNLVPGHPQFNGGDWGMWQINRGAWGGERWWTEAGMSDPAQQSRIVYRILSQKGTYWRPWGLTADGQLDTTHYQMWSSWQWENWIMAPFRTGLSLYPCKTTPPKKGRNA